MITSSASGLTRRAFIAAGAGLALSPACTVPAAAASQRVAIVDWALLETCLALEVTPLAAVELVLFRRIAVEPAVPDSVVDLGLRGSINLELLSGLRPDVIYGSSFNLWANDLLSRIAPVRMLSVFERGVRPYRKAESAMRTMAAELGVPDRADAYIAALDSELAATKAQLAARTDRPVLIINIGDPRHFRVFGEDSMFGEVAARLGFRNAWGARTSYSATAPVGLEALAKVPEAIVLVIAPIPPDAAAALPQSALWNAMPPVREGRVHMIEPVNPFGGLPAARRFARLFAGAIEAAA
ncbi:ABC transporter substrate-binding protein [Mangrovicella endophytica]|uniref:ABC transporter substrate-binding protein n=1 Tax=Mangrovicella endophytica TaxID=2066697 RepID=UPI000C9E3DEA|nr:ABC transporter substrate-binding protein [Mangrovicella endophytica]